jgi:hypothetical protein
VQNAARSVSAENRRLRALLNLHGVSESEISGFLSSPDYFADGIIKTPLGNDKRATNGHSSLQTVQPRILLTPTLIDNALSRSQVSSLSATIHSESKGAYGRNTLETTPKAILLMPTGSPSVSRSSISTVERHCQSDKVDYYQRCGGEDYQTLEQTAYFEEVPSDDIFPPVSDCFCPPGPSSIDTSRTEALEMSCDTAAAILVELQDQTDAERARIALGCIDTSSCSVKNTTIFRLMDELGGRQYDP